MSVQVSSSQCKGIPPAFAWTRGAAKSTSVFVGRLRSVVVVYCLLSLLLFACGVGGGVGVCSVFGEGGVGDSL